MAVAIAVGAAGAVGSVARYLLDGAVQDRTSGSFPFGTLGVNVVGSLVLGVLAGLALHHSHTATIKAVVGTGFCGGLTTWSTAAWEAVRLTEEGSPRTAATFTLVNLGASLVAAGVGVFLLGR
jgi:CrcB protein